MTPDDDIGPPVIPVDVVVHTRRQGDIICELVYRGIEDDPEGQPIHMWSCPMQFKPELGDSVTVGMLPAHTGIHFGEDRNEYKQ